MITYRWFTAPEIEEAERSQGTPELHALLRNALKESRNWKREDPVIVVALDGAHVAGYLKFTYGHIAGHDEKLRVAAAQDLYTNGQYRGQGIGSTLISKSMQLGVPCIYSGISGQAMPLYKKLGFTFIDCSPIFQLPLSVAAHVREWRTRLYHLHHTGHSPNAALAALRLTLQSRTKVRTTAATPWKPLNEQDACREAEKLTSVRARSFQVPWPTDVSSRLAKAGDGPSCALVLERMVQGVINRHFVSIYRRHASVRLPLTSYHVDLVDGHVNEIYPPLTDPHSACDLLRAVAAYGREARFDNLSIYAMTDALQHACHELGLNSSASKSVAIQPLGVSAALAAELVRPDKWWCRAMNEEQIEEAV